MRTILTLCLLLGFYNLSAGVKDLLPLPQKIEVNSKHLFLINDVKISTQVLHKELSDLIVELGGNINPNSKKSIQVSLVQELNFENNNPEEAYSLKVGKNNIEIEAITERGVYWAIQTLRQLKTTKKQKNYFEACTIHDYPAFRIRGFMQDVGRTYISLEELKREIAILAKYKINTFHWHLTEDLGWRLESKIYPNLNDSINFVRQPGMFYTLEEAKELVQFCKDHHVLLIPEIDMPGHSLAFRKAFNCDMQSEKGTAILKNIIDEVCATFDVPYLHIGTDEVEFTNARFVPEMVKYIRNKGKKVISWNPGWIYKPGEVDMTQLWSYRGKAQKGIPAIDSKYHYINHFDAFTDIVALYNSRILNVEQGDYDHAGSIIAVWHDRYVQNERDILLQNNFYPSILTLAERAWIGGGSEYFDDRGTLLSDENSDHFKTFENFEKRLLWHKEHFFKEYPFAYVKQTHIKWNITDAFPNNGDLNMVFPPELEEPKSSYIYNGDTYNTNQAIGASIYLRHVWGSIVPSFYKDPKPNHTAYAYTYVHSPIEQEVGAWINFQNYSRSEKDLAPKQGKWDYKESKIWINNTEIQPPVWQSTHSEKSNEIPLTNENFEVRPPIKVKLNKGWNKVFIKLPVAQFSSANIRLEKWMFTCVFVTPDGEHIVDNLNYSPTKEL